MKGTFTFIIVLAVLFVIIAAPDAMAQLPSSCQSFTDTTLVPGTTPIKAVHITQLRTCINALRALRSLSTYSWTDPTLTTQQTSVRATHILQLRTALIAVYTDAGKAAPMFSPISTGVTLIRAVHIQELRTAAQNAPISDPPDPPECQYSVGLPNQMLNSSGASGSMPVIIGNSCGWTATSQTTWLAIQNGSGSGDGAFSYTASANTGSSPRTALLTFQGDDFEIVQDGTSTTHPPLNDAYGMVIAGMGVNKQAAAEALHDLGTGMVRTTFAWHEMQPYTFENAPDFTQTNEFVGNMRCRGIEVFATISGTPNWANGGYVPNVPPLPEYYQYWDRFVFDVVQYYSGTRVFTCPDNSTVTLKVLHFGVWNEPNLEDFFTGGVGNYLNLVDIATTAIKQANSAAKVIGPEVSWHGVRNGYYQYVMGQVGHKFDIVTVHYYPDAIEVYDWAGFGEFLDNKVAPHRQGKPVWVSEIGTSNCDGRVSPWGYYNVGNETQAAFYHHALSVYQLRRTWVKSIFFFQLAPNTGCSESIIRNDFNDRRPAFDTYRDFIVNAP